MQATYVKWQPYRFRTSVLTQKFVAYPDHAMNASRPITSKYQLIVTLPFCVSGGRQICLA